MLPVTRSDAQWQKTLPFLLAHPKLYVGPQWSWRRFLSAVLWVSRSRAQWPTAAERLLRHSPAPVLPRPVRVWIEPATGFEPTSL